MLDENGQSTEAAIGLRASGIDRLVFLRAEYNGLTIAWGCGSGPVASLQLDSTLKRYRLDRTSTIRDLDMRRMRRHAFAAAQAEIAQLQRQLWGTTSVSFHQGAADEGLYVDELERRISSHRPRLSPKDFIATVKHWFDLPQLEFMPITGLGFAILPTSDESRSKDREVSRLELIHEAVRKTLDQTKTTGQRFLSQIERELRQYRGDRNAERQLGGGLVVTQGGSFTLAGGIAKTLGSGFRSLLLLAHKIMTSDICIIDEPETYLHPRIQEQLASFLLAHRHNCQIFLSTHSHVLLNALFDADGVRICELRGDASPAVGRGNAVREVYTNGLGQILDYLGVHAGQMLLANAVILVEGPSDRNYLIHWINLWSEGRLVEGKDYVCMAYGGSLLSYLSLGSSPDQTMTKLARLTRHCIVVMDSDRTSADAQVNRTKKRVCS
jgi:AAA domain, putative AbiEii toxin, Type IV TA system